MCSTVPVMFGYHANPHDGLDLARMLNDEIALDDEIQGVVGSLEVPLGEDPLRRGGAHPAPNLCPGGCVGPLGRGGARHAAGLVEQVLKVHPAPLEAGGVHVGQVVGDSVGVELLGRHTRRGGEQGTDH